MIGAGPGGLAVAEELGRLGLGVVVLESASRVGASWPQHYDRLHLHTARTLSSLPRTPIPRREGRWVSRDGFADYLGAYAEAHGLDVRLGVTATSIDKLPDGDWSVSWAGSAATGSVSAPLVVVATGYNHTSYLPDWPGLADYTGRLIHSSEYRNAADLSAQSALVVGAGNSGSEIAADLAQAGLSVMLAIRTPPNIVRRQVGGVPGQVLALAISPLSASGRPRVNAAQQLPSRTGLCFLGYSNPLSGDLLQLRRDSRAIARHWRAQRKQRATGVRT